MTSDDLPGLGESLVITSDARVIINEGETAVVQGVLSVNGTKNSNVKFEIENYGKLTIDGTSIRCSYGNFTIENRGYGVLTVQESQFAVIHDSTLNNGNLTTKNWLVKTTAQDATALVYSEGNLTFSTAFIENVEREVLEAVGSEGQEFVESSGGNITVTNKGLMTQQDITTGDSDSSMLLVVAVVAVLVVAGVVVYLTKKKKIL